MHLGVMWRPDSCTPSGLSFLGVVFPQVGLSLGWSFLGLVFPRVGLSLGYLSSGWFFLWVVFPQDGLSSGWSFLRAVFPLGVDCMQHNCIHGIIKTTFIAGHAPGLLFSISECQIAPSFLVQLHPEVNQCS